MTDADLTAIATYLKSLAGPGVLPAAGGRFRLRPEMTAGGAIYADACSACHGRDGKGVPYLFPLAGRIAERPFRRSDEPHSRPARGRAQRGDRTASRRRPECRRSHGS